MFIYIQTDVWMLTFPLHSVVDCVCLTVSPFVCIPNRWGWIQSASLTLAGI